jgi:hypothetical protein
MNLIDYILDLFRSPAVAADFIADPDGALRNVGLQNVSAAQFQAVAASAAPAGVMLGGGNPVLGLQRAVSDYHGIAAPFSPQTDLASHNDTQLASNNDLFSPDQSAGANAQNGAFNLGFGDITLGDKSTTTNTATGHGVVVDGDNGGDIVSGDGAALGNNNHMNNGDVIAGTGSNVNQGEGSIDDNGTTATNGQLKLNWPNKVLKGDTSPGFTIDLAHKDLSLIVDAANSAKVPMPMAAAAREAFSTARSRGFGGKDFSAMVDALCELASIAKPRFKAR